MIDSYALPRRSMGTSDSHAAVWQRVNRIIMFFFNREHWRFILIYIYIFNLIFTRYKIKLLVPTVPRGNAYLSQNND